MRTIIEIMIGTRIRLEEAPKMMVKGAETTKWSKNDKEVSLLEYAKMVVEVREEAERLFEIANELQNFGDEAILLQQAYDERDAHDDMLNTHGSVA